MPKRTKPAPQKFSGVHTPPFPGPKKPTLPLPRLTLHHRPAGFCLVPKPHECTGIPTDQMMRLRPSEARRLGQKLDTPLGVWNRPDPNSTHIEPSACHPTLMALLGNLATLLPPQQAGLRTPLFSVSPIPAVQQRAPHAGCVCQLPGC